MERRRVKTDGVQSSDGVIAMNHGEEFSVMGMSCYNGCGHNNQRDDKGVDNNVELR